MKLRTSFFNWTALRKDLLRYAPAWALYTIGGVMTVINVLGMAVLFEEDLGTGLGAAAKLVTGTIGPFGIINMVYALIVALLLYGDLFNSKLCNALHAMPMRREGWFFTHTLAGIAFSVVPNVVISMCMTLFLGKFWFVAPLWVLGMTLEYLFFFSLATLSVFCTGKRFAATVVYLLINFLSLIAAWFVASLYEPLLYGVEVRYTGFWWCSPVVWMCTLFDNLVLIGKVRKPDTEWYSYDYVFEGLGSGWLYLLILTVLAVGLLALALVLYRRRKLECAGDFIAFKPLGPVFAVIFTLSVAIFFQTFGRLFTEIGGYVFQFVGVAVGFFVSQMMLQRTVKVFRGKNFLICGIIGTALLMSIVLTWMDPMGLTRWTPRVGQVKSITLTEETYYDFSGSEDWSNKITVEDPALIKELIGVHRQILADGRLSEEEQDKYIEGIDFVHLVYRLKDGRKVERRYYYRTDGDVDEILDNYYSQPEYVLGYEDWDAFLEEIEEVCVESTWVLNKEEAKSLLEAVKADCESGTMKQDGHADWATSISIETVDGDYLYINIYEDCVYTLRWLKDYKDSMFNGYDFEDYGDYYTEW